ncbi:MAG: septation protein IspZ [Myxococcota bacterium]
MIDKKAVLRFARWLLETFGSIGVFLLFEHTVSLTAAIIATTVFGLLLVGLQIRRDGKASAFTVFVAASVAIFGALDLYFGASGIFIRIEPALGNASTGLFFLWSVLIGKPIIAEFARRSRGGELTPRALAYCGRLTVVWSLFFFVRTAFFLWVGFTVESIDEAIAMRAAVGLPSFLVMIGGDLLYRRLRYGADAIAGAKPQPELPPSPG